jgi:hypothetical protein
MTQNKLSFESENLVVHWISFKFQYLEDSTKTKIANYLFKIGFNSCRFLRACFGVNISP